MFNLKQPMTTLVDANDIYSLIYHEESKQNLCFCVWSSSALVVFPVQSMFCLAQQLSSWNTILSLVLLRRSVDLPL